MSKDVTGVIVRYREALRFVWNNCMRVGARLSEPRSQVETGQTRVLWAPEASEPSRSSITNSSLQEAAESALRRLLGLRLIGTKNLGSLRSFYFGELRLQEGKRPAPFVLDLLCVWRLEQQGRILTGEGDLYVQATGQVDSRWNPGDDWGHRQDEVLVALLGDRHLDFGGIVANKVQLVAEAVTTDPLGGFRLELSGNLVITAFPTHSTEEDWRLVTPEGESHVVVGGGALL